MFTVQVHRHSGPDEDFEAESLLEADEVIAEHKHDDTVRRIVVLSESGRIIDEVLR